MNLKKGHLIKFIPGCYNRKIQLFYWNYLYIKGYTGPNCQSVLSACYSYPCVNGLCDDLGNFQFSCLCFQGYTGSLCNQVKNICDAKPCQNGGTCNQTSPGVYVCNCPAGDYKWCLNTK